MNDGLIYLFIMLALVIVLVASNEGLVDDKKPDAYLHWVYNKPELRPQVKEHEYSPCGISNKTFVKYVNKVIRKYKIETIDIRWKVIDKLPGGWKDGCIGFAVLYMKEPMSVYRKRRAKEKEKTKNEAIKD